mmetsp:Transcript_1184/g.2698  ORF Transcript_1184/g.2698 Transcript_1184/m.2698 type:complete len:118 (+) Transcript_1184:379-732(+)
MASLIFDLFADSSYDSELVKRNTLSNRSTVPVRKHLMIQKLNRKLQQYVDDGNSIESVEIPPEIMERLHLDLRKPEDSTGDGSPESDAGSDTSSEGSTVPERRVVFSKQVTVRSFRL